jgi:uncharacterized protein YndB with AHSA1/START domain
MAESKNKSTAGTADREILVARRFDAPRELVWRAMTDPAHVVHWWGPRGFTMTIATMDVRVGGLWQSTLHGPDGANYPNHSVFREVVEPERLVFSNGGGREGGPGVSFVATWTFAEVAAGATEVTIHMVFPTAADRDRVVREFGALEGAKQTLERLAEKLPALATSKEFVLTREFAAPRELVWQAWTDAAHLQRWFGPKGFTMPVCAMDFRPGGVFHYCMKSPDGHEMWGKWLFQEIVPPERLVVITSFSDAQAGITRHPLSATWPLRSRSTTTLTERDGRTTLTLRWVPYGATDEEQRTFDGAHGGMTQGWKGTLDQLDAYLAVLPAHRSKSD